jgi:hypothetical protein
MREEYDQTKTVRPILKRRLMFGPVAETMDFHDDRRRLKAGV